jgi:hypothetical protein
MYTVTLNLYQLILIFIATFLVGYIVGKKFWEKFLSGKYEKTLK